MSTAIARNFQIGIDPTPTNNFTLYQPATPDGTLRLGNGNTGITSSLLTLTSAGNLGIGTSSPAVKTNIVGSAGVTLRIEENSSGNNTRGDFSANSTNVAVGAKSNSPLLFTTNDTERMRLDTSGNLGLGVTPSAWTIRALQIGSGFAAISTGVTNARIFANTYYDNAYRYVGTGRATQYEQDGYHAWYVSASGTAGNAISFTQAMTLDASGNLGVGVTSPAAKLDVSGDIIGRATTLRFKDSGNTTQYGAIYADSTTFNINAGVNNLLLYSAGSERARIDSSGRVIVGSSSVFPNPSLINVVTSAGLACGFAVSDNTASYRARFWWNGGTDGLGIFNSDNGPIRFGTTDTERARIDSSGRFLVGTTSASIGAVNCAMALDATTVNSGFGFGINGNASNTQVMRFAYAGTAVGSIVVGTSTTSYNTSSDYRLKENVQPMTGALAKVQALKPCTYKWKADGSDGEGFIAHELQAVVPQCVTGEKDAVDADGNPQYQGIDTSFLVATLTAAIQELKAEFDAYKATHP